jgi:DNA polymerase-3 subunit epsilon
VFCILDIESSGGAFGKESIIEIALFKYDGEKIVDQLISLVHTEKRIQPYVSKITGITNKMLIRAPRFHEIAKRIVRLTEDCILVGHNVPFDYRMLRQEYGRLGFEFERKTLDTITLAEELIPGLPAYGLDKLTKELGIYNANKHRAEGDARATLELFQILQEKDREKKIGVLGQSVVANDYEADKINDLLRSVKKNKGLYYLHGADGKLLYLGASLNIKGSLEKLLIADNGPAQELRQQIQSVRTELTGNSIVASIKRMEEIAGAKPPYNSGKKPSFDTGIYLDERGKEPFLYAKGLEEMGRKRPLCKVENRKKAQRLIRMYKRFHRNAQYREEVVEQLKKMPNEGIFITEGRKTGERCAFVISDKSFKGYFYFNLNQKLSTKALLDANLSPIKNEKIALQWLKQAILNGEAIAFKG